MYKSENISINYKH